MEKISELKVTTLAENTVMSLGFHGQWGLSFLIELNDSRGVSRKVILDAGNDKEPFLHNLRRLKISLSDVDAIVISHGHLDHTAAITDVIKMSGGCRVYAHSMAFSRRYGVGLDEKRRSLGVPDGQGLSEIESEGGELVLSTAPMEVIPGLWTTGEVPRVSFETVAPKSKTRWVIEEREGIEAEDNIIDDLSLYCDMYDYGPIIITGCAHAGPLNIIEYVKNLGGFNSINCLIGGLHLFGRDDEYIEKTINGLKTYNLKLLSPCHCTGFKASAKLMESFPEAFVQNFCGRVIEVGKIPDPRVV
jgi:7,8-dihydropterin-6-yl-methyl-4-(beta-D-ribofuranosyl)aminobenzene 5'-phosphate synthase